MREISVNSSVNFKSSLLDLLLQFLRSGLHHESILRPAVKKNNLLLDRCAHVATSAFHFHSFSVASNLAINLNKQHEMQYITTMSERYLDLLCAKI